MSENRKITALSLNRECSQTGAMAAYHVLDQCFISRAGAFVNAGFVSYVSKEKYDQGFKPFPYKTEITFSEVPPVGENLEQWVYAKAAESAEFAGAQTVYAE